MYGKTKLSKSPTKQSKKTETCNRTKKVRKLQPGSPIQKKTGVLERENKEKGGEDIIKKNN